MLTLTVLILTLAFLPEHAFSAVVKRGDNGLSDDEKQQMLDRHNLKRSLVSPSATLMTRMMWDDELAAGAQAWANNCNFGHSGGNYGENLYGSTAPPGATAAVDSWDNEKQWYTLSSNTCNPPPGKSCGHYTQVVWAASNKLGCGMKKCTTGSSTWYYVVCRYSPAGNVKGSAPYTQGTSCSGCVSNSDLTGECRNKLCLTREECSTHPENCGEQACGGQLFDCKNGGTANYETCGCDCAQYFTGATCEQYDCAQMGNNGADEWYCSQWADNPNTCADNMIFNGAVVKYGSCPQLCNLCP
ncbi:cysteine-rich venom protein ophanin-like [Lingula anatina]|uniref:Cysteine-rich venom protein ophanin-like n=1 Tax=Lingula anatina TaxID=7574 RepID=A0A1S3JBW3_LINAN|nr:cysteine-rich venom protein ophanin-like [Lingula anatina]|eukprot:XP_013407813.1 cysteine-rich venom protein ophanin-like [Lingula anatina]